MNQMDNLFQVALDNYHALLNFFEKFPHYKGKRVLRDRRKLRRHLHSHITHVDKG